MMQLEIEREALKKERDPASKERLSRIERELSDLKEQRSGVEAQLQREREVATRIRKLKEEIDQTRVLVERAQREFDYNKAAELSYGKIPKLEEELQKTEAQLSAGGSTLLKTEVDAQDIAAVVSKWTGVPVSKLLEGEVEKLVHMEERLQQRVVGQEEAVRAVANAIRRARAGLQDPNRPLGSFLFLGPTGVGKTELARALAEFLFDDEQAMIRIDMSEYMEKHSVARLIGAPPGYVGFEEGGQLTEAVRRKPYSVVLFDEIEKAHSDVFNVLLQILDDGRLTSGQGRVVSFRNTVIIMTSNIASPVIQEMTRRASSQEEIRARVLEELRDRLRPEFLNRIDEVIVFQPLTREDLVQIVDIQLGRLRQLLDARKIALELTDAAKRRLGEEGYDPVFGARPLKRLIQQKISNELSLRLLKGEFREGDKVVVDAGDSGFTFRKG
jgi:ATP-dependent Clp protease ATP-binding subunit ClpB